MIKLEDSRRRRRRMARDIAAFLDEFVLDEPARADPLAEGLLDSLAVETLLSFIEERFGVALSDEHVVAENFADLPTLVSLILDVAGGVQA